MGMRESLISDFEDKTIEYLGKKLYILKQFEYKGKTYLYGMDVSTIEKENVEVVFLNRVNGDVYEHVQDDALWDELFQVVSGLCTAEIVNSRIKDIYNKKTKKN